MERTQATCVANTLSFLKKAVILLRKMLIVGKNLNSRILLLAIGWMLGMGLSKAQPIADFTFTDSVCGAKTVKFTNTSQNANKFFWFIKGSFQTTTHLTYTFDSFKTYTVTLIVSDNSGNQDTVQKNVHLLDYPQFTLSPPPPAGCPGSVVFLLATYNNAFKYLWSPSYKLSDVNVHNPKASPLVTTTYKVLVIDTTTKCQAYDSVTIPVKPCNLPIAKFAYDPIACGNFTVTFRNRSSKAYGALWEFGDAASGASDTTTLSDTIITHTFSGPGTYKVLLTVSDSFGLYFDTISAYIGVDNVLKAVITTNPQTICPGETVQLNTSSDISGGATVLWQPGNYMADSTLPQVTAKPSSTTRFKLTYRRNGCVDTSSVLITVLAPPSFDILFDTVCFGDPMYIRTAQYISSTQNFIWDLGDGDTSTSKGPLHTYKAPGNYTVKITASQGSCSQVSSRMVTVKPLPETYFYYSPNEIFVDKPLVQFVDGGHDIARRLWDFGDGMTATDSVVSHSFSDTGYYRVSLINFSHFGCTDTVAQDVLIRPVILLYVPNAFTPNRQGPIENETFYLTCNDHLPEFHFILYNRWGQKIFETFDQHFVWDGTSREKPVEEGLYLWRMNYRISAEKGEVKTGELFIYR